MTMIALNHYPGVDKRRLRLVCSVGFYSKINILIKRRFTLYLKSRGNLRIENIISVKNDLTLITSTIGVTIVLQFTESLR